MLIGSVANTGVVEVPQVAEIDMGEEFRCMLSTGSNPESIEFGGLVDQDHRWLRLVDSEKAQVKPVRAKCGVNEDGTSYVCTWRNSSIALKLNDARWVYIANKTFHHTLTGEVKVGLLSDSRVVNCPLTVIVQ
jgi:hypothetical protein